MEQQKKPLIFQSDFGRADGAVSAMYGVAYSVCSELKISDLTHEIPQYDIWEASYRLIQTVSSCCLNQFVLSDVFCFYI